MTTAVGIDVGKAGLDLAVDGVRGVVRFANTKVGIRIKLRHSAEVSSTYQLARGQEGKPRDEAASA